MPSRLPRTRPSRRHIPRPATLIRFHEWAAARGIEARQIALSRALAAIGARLDRDPNGYAIAMGGRFVARCPNLDAVATWLQAHLPAREDRR